MAESDGAFLEEFEPDERSELGSLRFATVVGRFYEDLAQRLTFGAEAGFEVHMSGGHFKAPTLSLSGERSADYFKGLFVQKLFLATAGVSFDVGLTYPAIGDIYVKRAMVKAASHVYLLADSTKIGRVSSSALGGVEMVHTLITDDGISDADRAEFERRAVGLVRLGRDEVEHFERNDAHAGVGHQAPALGLVRRGHQRHVVGRRRLRPEADEIVARRRGAADDLGRRRRRQRQAVERQQRRHS